MDHILIELLDLLDSQTWIPVETQAQIAALKAKADAYIKGNPTT